MSFLVPTMLWGAVAASIPVIIHLLFRSHYRKVPWAAMKFLLDSLEQTSRRLKFQELLLLLLRIALLALLALTLARPMASWLGATAGGEAVDAVFVFDLSYSMDCREGRATRLETAQAAAMAVLDQLPLNSTVQIVTVADRARRLGPRLPARSAQARQVIASLEVTHLATDFLPGISEAALAFQQGDTAHKELYLFSDMQQQGWDRQAEDLGAKLRELHDRAAIYLVQCGTRAPKNVALVGLAPQASMPHAGQRVPFTVLVKNTGHEPVRNLTVTLAGDDGREKETQALAEVLAGETKPLTLMVRLNHAGMQIVSASLKQDELSVDNHLDRVIEVREKLRLLVIDGAPAPDRRHPEKAASFYLLHALLPVAEAERDQYRVQPQLITPREATAQRLANQDAVILVNVALEEGAGANRENLSPAFVAALADFVRQGHGLLIFGGDRVTPAQYNTVLLQQHGVLPCKLSAAEIVPAALAMRLDRQSAATGSPFALLAGDDYYQALAGVEIRRRLGTEALAADAPSQQPEGPAACRVLLRYSDGHPAVVARRVDRGQVVLVTTSADVSWTDWPRWQGMYVPFIDLALRSLLGEPSSQHNLTAGETLRFRLPECAERSTCVLVDPHGKSSPVKAESINESAVVMDGDTSLSGAYWLTWADRFPSPVAAYRSVPAGIAAGRKLSGAPFAVAANFVESENLEPLSAEEVDARLGFRPIHLVAGEDLAGFAPRIGANSEWSLYFLLGVCGLCLVESVFAWFCGRIQ